MRYAGFMTNHLIKKTDKSFSSVLLAVLFAMLVAFGGLAVIAPNVAFAQESCTAKSDGTDTDEFAIKSNTTSATGSGDSSLAALGDSDQAKGLVSGVVGKIKDKLSDTSKNLFKAITEGKGYIGTLRAAMTLYIAIYGILFMAGIAEIKFNEFIIMLTKFAIVGALLSSGSWEFFSSTVVTFFNDGTDYLINEITKIAVGGEPAASGSSAGGMQGAFSAIDIAVSKAVSSKMMVTVMAALPANLYGVLFGGMLVASLFLFMTAVLKATWVYVMSLAMRTLLFGLAPIFIPCILFQRTRHLFDGWINQIVAASIQPVLLFIFLTFFVRLMDASMANVLHTPVCWSPLAESWRGSPFELYFWRFMKKDDAGHWQPRTGEGSLDEGFPIDLIAILTFLILAYLANSFNSVVMQISQQLSSASSNLAGSNPISEITGKIFGGGGSGGVSGLLGGKRKH